MKNPNSRILILWFIPFISLFILVVQKTFVRTQGQEVILKITGYDPRDLISGHYLTYRVLYEVDSLCATVNGPSTNTTTSYVCLDPKKFSTSPIENCQLQIRGKCEFGRFMAGIERYYIPQEKAKELDQLARQGDLAIKISVLPNGQAQVKELLKSSMQKPNAPRESYLPLSPN